MASDYTLSELKSDLVPIIRRMPAYAKLIGLLIKDPGISKANKAKLTAGLAYLVSPIDLIPGIIPVLGQLDDILAVLIVLNNVLASSPSELADSYLAQVNLDKGMVKDDTRTVSRVIKNITVTLTKKAGRGLLNTGRYIGRKLRKL